MYIDLKQAYPITSLENRNKTNIPNLKYLTRSKLYKFKCLGKRVYHIQIEEYGEQVQFIKFYPSKHVTNDKRFQLRTKSQPDTNRILATCLKLVVDLVKANPQHIFAFFGQWDETDVKKERGTTQRFNIYTSISFSYFPKELFHQVELERLNLYFLLPKSHYQFDTDEEIQNFIINELAPKLPVEKFRNLIIPEK